MRIKKEDTMYVWRELLLACIGEQFVSVVSKGDDICGVTVSVRQYDNIVELWNRDASANLDALLKKVKLIVPNAELTKAFYKPNKQHSAFTNSNSSNVSSEALIAPPGFPPKS